MPIVGPRPLACIVPLFVATTVVSAEQGNVLHSSACRMSKPLLNLVQIHAYVSPSIQKNITLQHPRHKGTRGRRWIKRWTQARRAKAFNHELQRKHRKQHKRHGSWRGTKLHYEGHRGAESFRKHRSDTRVAVATIAGFENTLEARLSHHEVFLLIKTIRSNAFLSTVPIFVHTMGSSVPYDDTNVGNVTVVHHDSMDDWGIKLFPLQFSYPSTIDAVIYFDSDVVLSASIDSFFSDRLSSHIQCKSIDQIADAETVEEFYSYTQAQPKKQLEVCNAGVYSIPTHIIPEFVVLWDKYMRIRVKLADDQGPFTAAAAALGKLSSLPSNANFCTKCLSKPTAKRARILSELLPREPLAVLHHHACRSLQDGAREIADCSKAVRSNLLEAAKFFLENDYRLYGQNLERWVFSTLDTMLIEWKLTAHKRFHNILSNEAQIPVAKFAIQGGQLLGDNGAHPLNA